MSAKSKIPEVRVRISIEVKSRHHFGWLVADLPHPVGEGVEEEKCHLGLVNDSWQIAMRRALVPHEG